MRKLVVGTFVTMDGVMQAPAPVPVPGTPVSSGRGIPLRGRPQTVGQKERVGTDE